MIADMHTHSENSHDSVCKIDDMRKAQAQKNTDIFAVCDHFDTDSYKDYDVFSPIEKAYETVCKLNENQKETKILSGIEISEGFWHKNVYEKAHKLVDYDVIIGSVHLVKYPGHTIAYSKIDFSKLDIKTVEDYLDSYFNDVLTMTEEIDFDILAHLNCPLRYIKGKYNLNPNMKKYEEKIEKILKNIIKRNSALEVNTSSYDLLGTSMPSTDILSLYKNLGGELITLGSDAHTPEDASANFDKALEEIRKIGFKNILYYQKRKPVKIKI